MGPSLDTIEGGGSWARGPLSCLPTCGPGPCRSPAPHTVSIQNPPLKVEGLADMAPCHSLWASETPSVFYQRCCKDLL